MTGGSAPEEPRLSPEEQAALTALFTEVVASFRGAGRDPNAMQGAIGAQVLYVLNQQAAEGAERAKAILAALAQGATAGFREAAAAAGLAPSPGPQRAAGEDVEAER